MKKCGVCGEEKALGEFYVDRQKTGGHRPECRECLSRIRSARRRGLAPPRAIRKTAKIGLAERVRQATAEVERLKARRDLAQGDARAAIEQELRAARRYRGWLEDLVLVTGIDEDAA